MISAFDGLVLSSAFIGFLVYLAIHFFVFRQVKDKRVIQSLINTFLMGSGVNLSVSLFLVSRSSLSSDGILVPVLLIACSFFVYGLACFIYVLCVFGPYESSIRLRLLREIEMAGKDGMTKDELLAKYNTEVILTRRLNRFIGSGEVILESDRFRIGKKKNFFSFLEGTSRVLQKITKSPVRLP